MKARSLSFIDREAAAWMGRVERGVIIPLKWVVLALCVAYWMWARNWAAPEPPAFAAFFLFAALTIAEHYFFARDRVTPSQVPPFVYTSFAFDGLFVGGLIVLDMLAPGAPANGRPGISDFNVLYLLLILRGFALFRSEAENVAGFLGVSALFAATAMVQLGAAPLLEEPARLRALAMIWALMLIGQGFVTLINRQKEQEFRARERQVRSASLASLGELAAGVAHEINNPIGIIKTYCDFLIQTTPEDNPLREDFETIRNEASNCEEIVRRMLDFSNPKLHGLAPVDVGSLAQETARFVFHEGHTEAVVLEIERPDTPLPPVHADAVQLKQALLNIMMNARQLLGEYAAMQPPDYIPRVWISLGRGTGPRPPIRIAVRDNGPGISPEDAERVFEPFFTKRRQGTGLGLAITRRIIEAHNGTIRLAPHSGGGTVATVELPIEGEEAP